MDKIDMDKIDMDKIDMDIFKCADVKEICQPLKDYFNITTFSYLNIYSDLSRIHLDYHHKWTEYFYKNIAKYTADEKLTELTHWEPGFSTLYALEDPCIPDGNLHGIGNGIVIANDLGDCTELCYIGTKLTDGDIGTSNLLNNIDLLQNFIRHFRGKASTLIEEAKKSPITLPNTSTDSPKRTFSLKDETKLKFINELNSELPPITPREYQCLKLLSSGLSTKEIAHYMNVSPKTIDRHFENIKAKHGLKRKSGLLNLV